MRCVILTGMSGSGNSTSLKMIEDMGYYCVGNLPITLVESFVELAENDPELEKVAINVDIRSGQNIGDLTAVLDRLQEPGKTHQAPGRLHPGYEPAADPGASSRTEKNVR